MDKPQRIEGLQWDGGVIDESSDIKPGTFSRVIVPLLTWRNGWCDRIGVPKRTGIGAREFRQTYEKAIIGELPEHAGFTWKSKDILPKHFIDKAMAILDAKDYAEQFDAQWQTAGGGIFYAFNRDLNVRRCEYDSSKPLIVGMDFNVDPMCWVFGHTYPNQIEWFKELELRDTNTVAMLDAAYQLFQNHRGGVQFYPDASSANRHTSASETDLKQIFNHKGFKELGRSINVTDANPRLADRFAATNAMICNAAGERRMFFDPACESAITDMEIRAYKPGTKEPEKTEGVGHFSDAVGYPTHWLFPIQLEIEETTPNIVTHSGGYF